MYENSLKSLVVVLAVAAMVFTLAKPWCARFMTDPVFRQRRNAWYFLTVVAFLSPSFWIFAAVAAGVAWHLGRRDPNPIAIFVMLAFVVPPVRFGMNYAPFGFDTLTLQRILSLVLLLPWVLAHSRARDSVSRASIVHFAVVLFGAVQVLAMVPYEPFTRSILRASSYVLDVYLVFLVAARLCTERRQFIDVLATLCLVAAIMAPTALFESIRGWPLYGAINNMWGEGGGFRLFREGVMRAAASTGHALTLGYYTGLAFGVWLFLTRGTTSRWRVLAGAAWMWMGLIAAYSRAPWLMAILLYVCLAALTSGSTSKLFKSLLVLTGIGTVVLVSPLGDQVVALLPFVGSVETKNIDYRQVLLEATWAVVQQNPWFGDPFAILSIDEARNSQGIVDLVNAYASVALNSGLVGLTLYVLIQTIPMWNSFKAVRRLRAHDPELAAVGACLVACMLATIFFLFTSGGIMFQYVLIGLLTAYVSAATQRVSAPNWRGVARAPARAVPTGRR